MGNIESGYYKINGTQRTLYWDSVQELWHTPEKDRLGKYTYIGRMDKQPKVKSAVLTNECKGVKINQ
jgi:hypothetical protein